MNSRNKLQISSSKEPSTAMAAVAFQDHLLQDMSIGKLSLSDCSLSKPSIHDKLKHSEKRRKNALKGIKPTIDTGRISRKKATAAGKEAVAESDREYVLDPKPRPLSLAERMGLVACNADERLSETEWAELKQVSMRREAFHSPCVICKDDFRLEDQVLLSCSHVFHRACLHAFERFTGRKNCPMCRRSSYQTRVVHEGGKLYRHRSATRIQAAWRGHVVRKWYGEVRRTNPPRDPRLRRAFFERKLAEITDRLVAMTSRAAVDRFLDDIDRSVAESRDVYKQLETVSLRQMTADEWQEVELRAVERAVCDCPICLRKLHLPREDAEEERSIVLLSCSHVFHSACLTALEDFAADDPSPSVAAAFKCPVCRSRYCKRFVDAI